MIVYSFIDVHGHSERAGHLNANSVCKMVSINSYLFIELGTVVCNCNGIWEVIAPMM